jgi:superfamily II DNA or RNA helicase
MLRDLELLPVYDSAEHDLAQDLIVPLLASSKLYLRGVGYFSSGWLRAVADGLVELVENGGHARFVLSPILNATDWSALQTGERARREQELARVLQESVSDLRYSLREDTRNCLAWLVADEVVDFRFAIPRDPSSGGDYHDKVGIFVDECGDYVAMHGSFNDTLKGTLNGEALSVFRGWEDRELPYAMKHRTRLEALWEQGNEQFTVVSLPEAVRRALVELRTSPERPYRLPSETAEPGVRREPTCSVSLRPYQEEAIRNWRESACRGIFEMATGTGKTVTALAAAVSCYQEKGALLLVVMVPYLHLLEQWKRQCRQFGFTPVLCSGSHHGWQKKARLLVQDVGLGVLPHACLLVVHDTAASSTFGQIASLFPAENTLLIADETHSLGAPVRRAALTSCADMRLGLSATPHRWYDEEGTQVLMDFFSGVCYEFSLARAIKEGFLTRYEYHPVLVELNESEVETYARLSAQIAALHERVRSGDAADEQLKTLLIERSRVIQGAQAKIVRCKSLLSDMMRDAGDGTGCVRDVLVYCAPGCHKEVLHTVAAMGLRCHEFVHTVGITKRQKVLDDFAEGRIQVIVAIKCLDEGVDVPSMRTAMVLASTTNPREFVQRRGRILRRAPGKDRALIYDFIVCPASKTERSVAESILRREMPRFAELSETATNRFAAREPVRKVLERYGLVHLLDEKPWDVYNSLLAAGEILPDCR